MLHPARNFLYGAQWYPMAWLILAILLSKGICLLNLYGYFVLLIVITCSKQRINHSFSFNFRYEPPSTCVIPRDTGDSRLFRPACGFKLCGHIKKEKGAISVSFWLPQAPPGFVSLGCIASKGSPKQDDLGSLRCIRNDLVTASVFPEESIWDSSDTGTASEPLSIWGLNNEACTFFARSGLKRPPKRFALRLADSSVPDNADDTVIDVEMKTFSAAVYDDYAGLVRI